MDNKKSFEELMPLSTLTPKEKKTREFWLKLSIVRVAFTCILSFFMLKTDETLENRNAAAIASLVILIFAILFWYLFYQRAYKKHGTFLLTLYLVIMPIFFLLTDLPVFFKMRKDVLMISIFLVTNFLAALWYLFCFKLLRINKKLRMQPVELFAERCSESIEPIRQANTLPELEKAYHRGIQNWPHFELYLSREYENKKKALASTQ